MFLFYRVKCYRKEIKLFEIWKSDLIDLSLLIGPEWFRWFSANKSFTQKNKNQQSFVRFKPVRLLFLNKNAFWYLSCLEIVQISVQCWQLAMYHFSFLFIMLKYLATQSEEVPFIKSVNTVQVYFVQWFKEIRHLHIN